MADCAHFFGALESEARVLKSFCAGLLNQTENSNHMEIQSHTENHAVCVKEQYSQCLKISFSADQKGDRVVRHWFEIPIFFWVLWGRKNQE